MTSQFMLRVPVLSIVAQETDVLPDRLILANGLLLLFVNPRKFANDFVVSTDEIVIDPDVAPKPGEIVPRCTDLIGLPPTN